MKWLEIIYALNVFCANGFLFYEIGKYRGRRKARAKVIKDLRKMKNARRDLGKRLEKYEAYNDRIKAELIDKFDNLTLSEMKDIIRSLKKDRDE